jgi:CheY-like chemotaxis protein
MPVLDHRVLLVEDGPDNQRLLAFLLEKAGAKVTIAENGQVAIEKIVAAGPSAGESQGRRFEPFDVVLMDMQMPVLDGYEAARRLRTLGYTSPIVALTANAMSQDRQQCLDAGCDNYLAKPIEQRTLLEMVAQYPSRSVTSDHAQPSVARAPGNSPE